MKSEIKKLTNYTFGSASAIITNISLIVGLAGNVSKTGIIGGLLVIGVADNISDSLGIHIYKESEAVNKKESLISTVGNFTARLVISFTFILIIQFLPANQAQIAAIVWGLFLIAAISYFISKYNKANLFLEIIKHITAALIVIAASKYIGSLINNKFSFGH